MPMDPLGGVSPSYGPFTGAITGPLSPKQEQQAMVPGYAGKSGAIVSFVDNFLQGFQQGRRTQFERSEQQKADSFKLFNTQYQAVLNSPDISPEGKAAAQDLWNTATSQTMNEAAESAHKGHRDNPLWHFTKAVAGALAGPDQDPNHIDYNAPWLDKTNNKYGINPITAMAAIAHDEKFRVDPSKVGLPIQFAAAVRGGDDQTAPAPKIAMPVQQQAQPAEQGAPNILTQGLDKYLPAQAAPGQAQPQAQAQAQPAPILTQGLDKYQQPQAQPSTGPSPQQAQPVATTPALPPMPANKAEFLNSPEVQKRIAEVQATGRDWRTTSLYDQYNALPNAGGVKPIGATYVIKDPNDPSGKKWVRMRDFQDAAGNISHVNEGEASAPTSASGLKPSKEWVVIPGSQIPFRAVFKPGEGYFDVNDKKLPEGTRSVAAPTIGSGMAAQDRQNAAGLLYESNVDPNAHPELVTMLASRLSLMRQGVTMQGQQQTQAIRGVTAGIGAGKGYGDIQLPGGILIHAGDANGRLNLRADNPYAATEDAQANGAVTPPLNPAPATPAPAKPAAAAPATGPVASPSPAPKKSTLSAAGVSNVNQQDNIQTYLATGGSTSLSNPRVIQGRQALEKMTGLDPVSLDSAVTEYRANKKALADSIDYASAFNRVEQQLKTEGQVLIDAANNAKLGDTPLANKTALWIRQNAAAHPELQRYVLALNAMRTAYSTMLSNAAKSNAPLLVSAAKAGEAAVNDNSTMKDIAAAVDQMKIEAGAKQSAFTAQQDDIKRKLLDSPIGKALQPKTAPLPQQNKAAVSEVPPAGIADRMVDGQEVVSPTGARWVKRNGKLEKK